MLILAKLMKQISLLLFWYKSELEYFKIQMAY